MSVRNYSLRFCAYRIRRVCKGYWKVDTNETVRILNLPVCCLVKKDDLNTVGKTNIPIGFREAFDFSASCFVLQPVQSFQNVSVGGNRFCFYPPPSIQVFLYLSYQYPADHYSTIDSFNLVVNIQCHIVAVAIPCDRNGRRSWN